MKVFSVENLPRRSVCIGRTGENGYTALSFDVSSWREQYPDGCISIVYRRPDDVSYVVAGECSGESTLVWTVSECDLAVAGYGELELRVMSGTVIGKSERMSLKIKSALTPGERPASVVRDWVDRLLERIVRSEKSVMQAAEVAAQAQTDCRQMQEEVAASGERALDILRENERYATSKLFAGALRGSAVGSGGVRLDGVSEVEHDMACYVYGKNLIPYPYKSKAGSSGGLSFTVQEDGGIAVEGTATASVTFDLFTGALPIPPGKYTVGGHVPLADGRTLQVAVRKRVKGKESSFSYYDGGNTQTVTEETEICRISIFATSGTVVPEGTVIYPTLCIGAEALSPFVTAQPVECRTYGKNLFGGTLEVGCLRADLVVNGNDGSDWMRSFRIQLPAGTYRLSFGGATRSVWRRYTDGVLANESATVRSYDFTTSGGLVAFTIATGAYGAAWDDSTLVQITLGAATTEYEPYREGESVQAEVGVPVSVTSIAPCTSVIAPSGATVYVKYNKDIAHELGRIEKAILSLGGNV